MTESWNTRVLWWSALFLATVTIFSTALAQVASVLFMVLWLVMIVRSRGVGSTWTAFHWPMLAFIAARLLSVFYSTNFDASLPALHKEIVFYLIFFATADVLAVDTERRAVVLMRLVIVTAVAAAIIGSGKYLAGIDARASSTTSGYYTLGLYLAAVFPLALALGHHKAIFPSRWLWWFACAIIAVGVLLTFNRIHWVVMALAVLVVGVIRERRFLVVFLCAAAAAALAYPPLVQRLSQIVAFSSSSSGRDVLWRGALMLIDNHPILGFGPRTFSLIFPLASELPDKGVGGWHNDFLQVYMDSGLVGLLALLWLVVVVVWKGAAACRRPGLSPFTRDLLLALLLSMAVYFVAGGVLDTLGGLLFRMLLGLLAVMSTRWVSTAPGPAPSAGFRADQTSSGT
jgi:O-antigen ligase